MLRPKTAFLPFAEARANRVAPQKSRRLLACLLLVSLCGALFACGGAKNPPLRIPSRTLSSSVQMEAETALPALAELEEAPSDGADDSDSDSFLPPEPKRVSVLAVGDNLIHRGIYRNASYFAKNQPEKDYDFTPIFEDVRSAIAGADLAIINQETMFDPLSEPANYPNFNTPDEIADDLAAVGFDVVSLANNHMLDVGSKGLLRTIQRLDSVEGVTRVGAYTGQADMDRIRVLEKDGLRIAVVAFTYGTNGYSSDSSVKIPYLTEENVRSQMKKATEVGDFVLVIVHWGEENSYTVTKEQKNFASLFAECGADVILGSHPHVLQPIEWIVKEDGSRVLCVYSLGNLVSMMAKEANMLGGVLTFDICSNGSEHPHVENVLFEPTVYYYRLSDWYGNHVYYLKDFTDELAASHGVGHYGNRVAVKNLYRLAKQQIAAEFLPDYVNGYSAD